MLGAIGAVTILGAFSGYGLVSAFIPGAKPRLAARLRNNRRLARWLARAIGLRLEISGRPEGHAPRYARLILANHTSILDIIALASLEEAVFVTSQEMAEAPGIGALARFGGATFVERRNRDGRSNELRNLTELLADQRTVVIFPEGTSTNGTEILRFRNGLLHCAYRCPKVEIQPIALRFLSIGGEPVGDENRDRLTVHGEISIGAHLLRLFTNPSVRMTVTYLPSFFAHECRDADAIAKRAEMQVRAEYFGSSEKKNGFRESSRKPLITLNSAVAKSNRA